MVRARTKIRGLHRPHLLISSLQSLVRSGVSEATPFLLRYRSKS
jgi:hypothetical protein